MTDEEWKEYQSNTGVMFEVLESCLKGLISFRRNVCISRTGNLDEGRRVHVELMNNYDVSYYNECISSRKDVLDYFKLQKKYFWSNNGYMVREVFLLDGGYGLTEYEFIYRASDLESE